MPFWDREIELVVSTHPQKDHYFGLIEVFRRYKVDNFLYNPDSAGTDGYGVLEKEVGSEGAKVISPSSDKTIRLGLIYLDILWPPEGVSVSNPNNLGIVSLLRYGNFEALLSADVENEISDKLAADSKIRNLDYIKVNHHGSRSGLSENLLKAVNPKIAVISVGRNNIYGHPHKEILDMLSGQEVKILRTDLMGDVIVETDGEKIWVKD